jgi:O-acetyl-ADP-ribose deacetylase
MVFPDMKIEVMLGNLVSQPDLMAIVNSANANLRLGSGVAGAVHTGAGQSLKNIASHLPLWSLAMLC